jgi:hypothetical protein
MREVGERRRERWKKRAVPTITSHEAAPSQLSTVAIVQPSAERRRRQIFAA